ncbi:MAG TPA: RDD family protein [Rubrobacteraceae bacterium]|nr:RDD family protein [Rubrobacteraceae bacterium]
MNDAPRDLETVSVTLEEGVHFVGRIDGFSIDTVAEESVGGRGGVRRTFAPDQSSLAEKIAHLSDGTVGTLVHHGGNGRNESYPRERKREMTHAAPEAPIAATMEVHVTGRRILATIVDGLVFGVLYAVMAALFGTVASTGAASWSGSLPAFWSVVYAALIVLYYVLLEGYLGQTVGKMLFGIKVVREDNGDVPGLGGATIRTVLRLIDGLFSYLVAFITVLISGKNQRLGDMAAHTLVVRK